MEALRSSETSVFTRATRRNIPEYSILHPDKFSRMQTSFKWASIARSKTKADSVAFSPQANYTDWATATCWQNLGQLLRIEGCRVVSTEDPPGPLSQFSRPEPLLFFQVAPQLSSQGLSGPRSRPIATQRIWQRRESIPGPLDLQTGSLTTRPQGVTSGKTINRTKFTELSTVTLCGLVNNDKYSGNATASIFKIENIYRNILH
jgi:hypothetical protein